GGGAWDGAVDWWVAPTLRRVGDGFMEFTREGGGLFGLPAPGVILGLDPRISCGGDPRVRPEDYG
ncbi:hypothetical protein DYI42_21530, partial [Vannielia litorea]|nr:hypothetical protein [Vannielia litorea]